MRFVIPKELSEALDICTPYLVLNDEAKMMVLREGTPQEIRELYKKTCEKIDEIERKTIYYS